MKKLISLIILFLSLVTLPVHAQDITTYERNENNRYGIKESIELNSTTKYHALKIPYIDSSIYVYDFANLLTDSEITFLQNTIKNLDNKDDYGIVIVTTNNVNNLSTQEYADDFYDYNNFSQSGILLLIDMENREVYISTTYYGQIIFDNDRVEDILDVITPKLSNANYYNACSFFLEMVESYIEKGPSASMKNCEITNSYGDYTCPKMLPIPFIILFSIFLSSIVTFLITRKYKKIILAKDADYYLKKGNITLGNKIDKFVNTHTTRTYINTSSSSSSGGSHHSSSGSLHGGGGRSF